MSLTPIKQELKQTKKGMVFLKKQHLATTLVAATLLGTLSPTISQAATIKTDDKIHMIQVLGDAILIESNGKYGLIDGGEDSDKLTTETQKTPLTLVLTS